MGSQKEVLAEGGIAPAELTLQVICSGRVVPVPPVPLGYQL